jgi:putative SOS response-associated peptidase YedK
MCGRFTNNSKPDWYKREFKVGKLNPAIHKQRYNIAPPQMIDEVIEPNDERTGACSVVGKGRGNW